MAIFVVGLLQLLFGPVVHEGTAQVGKKGEGSEKEAHLHLEQGAFDHGFVGGFGEGVGHFHRFPGAAEGGSEADDGGEGEESSAAPEQEEPALLPALEVFKARSSCHGGR